MLCILCSGQGDQHPDLFARLRANSDAAWVLETAIREQWIDQTVADWLTAESPDSTLLHTDRFAQPLLALYQQAVWTAIKSHLPRVSLFAGLSLGELCAAGCAGAMGSADVVRVAGRRAEFMDAASPPGRLVSVLGLGSGAIAELCAETGAAAAIQTAADHWTLGCLAAQVEGVVQAAQSRGASLVKALGVTVASHTHWMEPAVEPFRVALMSAGLQRPQSPILSGTTSQRLWTPEQIMSSLCAQLHTQLRWDVCIEAALSSGIRRFLELGPGATLSHTILGRDPTVAARSVQEFGSLTEAASWASQPA
ncbi:MAG: acyltransferase domain-containing protein [Gemmataceae bacterium]